MDLSKTPSADIAGGYAVDIGDSAPPLIPPASMLPIGMPHDAASLILALVVENTELRAQLAEVQDQGVDLSIDAGEIHARLEVLQAALVVMQTERDAGRDAAEGRTVPAISSA